jgi:anti-sigma factor RsiW
MAMTQTDCQSWTPVLSAFIDGELAPARERELERHLSACPKCAAQVDDLRTTSALVRVGMEMRADEADFSDFAEKVFAKITPERLPWLERWKLSLSELFTYHRTAVVSSLAAAAIAVLVAVPLALRARTPVGYASSQLAVQQVSTLPDSHLAPVVMKGDNATIIWLVNHRHTLSSDSQPAPTSNVPQEADSGNPSGQNPPLKQQRPRGGEL